MRHTSSLKRGYLLPAVLLLSLGLLALHATTAPSLRLSIVGLDQSRRPTLELSGLTDGSYVLEASTNLSKWFTLTSAPAAQGPLRFQHLEAPSSQSFFYRGVKSTEAAPAIVVAEIDPSATTTAVVTYEDGGYLSLTNAAGVRYTFTVPPSNVVDSVAVRMTLITNFNSFPYENQMRTGVKFEPDGFVFHGAGLLQIQFPTNIPPLQVTSFGFSDSGSRFHLKPDLAATNSVRIPVAHFSGVGTGLWQPTERTKAVTKAATDSRDRAAHDLGILIAEERGRQLLGSEGQGDWNLGAEVYRKQQEYYDNYLKPFFAEAEKNCALAEFLVREVLAMERTAQLLGLDEEGGGRASLLGSPQFQKWKCNCLKEAIDGCALNKIGATTFVRAWLGMERESQLLGGGDVLEGCGLGSTSDMFEQLGSLPCSPEWVGSAKYSGKATGVVPANNGQSTATFTLTVDAPADRSEVLEDLSFPPFFVRMRWQLDLAGIATGSEEWQSSRVEKLECGETRTTGSSSVGGSGPLDIQVEFEFENGELTDFVVYSTSRNGNSDLEMPGQYTNTETYTPCPQRPGSGYTHSEHGKMNTPRSIQHLGIDDIEWVARTPSHLEGSFNGKKPWLSGIDEQFRFTFSFRRKKTH